MKKRMYHCTRETWDRLEKEVKITIFSDYGTLDTPADKFLMRGQDILLSREDMATEILLMMHILYRGKSIFLKVDWDSYILVMKEKGQTNTLLYQNSARFCTGYTTRDLVAYFCYLAKSVNTVRKKIVWLKTYEQEVRRMI